MPASPHVSPEAVAVAAIPLSAKDRDTLRNWEGTVVNPAKIFGRLVEKIEYLESLTAAAALDPDPTEGEEGRCDFCDHAWNGEHCTIGTEKWCAACDAPCEGNPSAPTPSPDNRVAEVVAAARAWKKADDDWGDLTSDTPPLHTLDRLRVAIIALDEPPQ